MSDIDPDEALRAVRRAFNTTQTGAELGLIDACVDDGDIVVTFRGRGTTHRALFAARVTLPRTEGDAAWTKYPVASIAEWAQYAVLYAAAEAYDTGDVSPEVDPDNRQWLHLN